jgi:hypothetical protein
MKMTISTTKENLILHSDHRPELFGEPPHSSRSIPYPPSVEKVMMSGFDKSHGAACAHVVRNFFVTRNWYMGLVPSHVAKGDIIKV